MNQQDEHSPSRAERVLRRAYAIWESEGRPEGRDQEHWRRAQDEISAEHGDEDSRLERPDATVNAPQPGVRQNEAESQAVEAVGAVQAVNPPSGGAKRT